MLVLFGRSAGFDRLVLFSEVSGFSPFLLICWRSPGLDRFDLCWEVSWARSFRFCLGGFRGFIVSVLFVSYFLDVS